ncbi:hypothetical protein DER45DRAFT_640939 [Fusarium avenaceum]|nr:hypothetical protein DER45DRAFT_640939 [Fusarium avenaceum]
MFTLKACLWAAVATAMPLIELSTREVARMDELERNKPVAIRQNPPLMGRANRIVPVVVGGPQDTFVPNMIRAAAGDVIQFQFSSGNHTVTQSAEESPCQPLQATQSGVIHSGHIPFEAGQTTVGTFSVVLTNTEPIYLYCATGPHCQIGQVMAINPPSEENLVQFNKKAAGALANIDGGDPTGGTVGEIPLAEAAFTPAAEEEAPPPPPADTPAADAPPAASPPPAVVPPAPPVESPPPAPPAETPAALPPSGVALPPPSGTPPPPPSAAAPPTPPSGTPPPAPPAGSAPPMPSAPPAGMPPAEMSAGAPEAASLEDQY